MRAARSIRALFAMIIALGLAIPAPAFAAPNALPRTTGNLLRNDTGLYPRVIRLQHSGAANGQLIASVVGFDGGGNGAIYRSTNDGATFTQIGAVRDQAAPLGICCNSLFELPKQIGAMPEGTLIWSVSIGQDAAYRRMTISLWQSQDHGVSWSFLSTCQNAPNTGGLWEPELSVDTAGDLVCHYSDETDPAHSQKLVERFSSDGIHWSQVYPTVAPPAQGLRPGMAVVRRLGSGLFYMTYEICGTGNQYDCAVHYRTSVDGGNWGPPDDQGPIVTTATGQYFTHAPTLAAASNGRLLLVGQQFREANGAIATTSGRTVLVNTEGGGNWFPINAPVAVDNPPNNYCPNYSSPLLPSTDGTRVLEIATAYDGSICKPYYATGSSQGTQDSTGFGLVSGRTYRLINVLSAKCLDVSADSRAPGGNIQQWNCNSLGPQNFLFTQVSPGVFTLRGQNSGLCVGVDGGGTAPGTNVSQWDCAGAAQQWRPINEGDGYWSFRSASGNCLDVSGGSAQAGANVQQWTCNRLSPQIWKLEPR